MDGPQLSFIFAALVDIFLKRESRDSLAGGKSGAVPAAVSLNILSYKATICQLADGKAT